MPMSMPMPNSPCMRYNSVSQPCEVAWMCEMLLTARGCGGGYGYGYMVIWLWLWLWLWCRVPMPPIPSFDPSSSHDTSRHTHTITPPHFYTTTPLPPNHVLLVLDGLDAPKCRCCRCCRYSDGVIHALREAFRCFVASHDQARRITRGFGFGCAFCYALKVPRVPILTLPGWSEPIAHRGNTLSALSHPSSHPFSALLPLQTPA
ncbi:hypothetical protein GGR50DRAFT_642032 [Xylaria sp. CBS 124048]|nr:hypothetical protein GGR50DRAFT_642032 [Xylaria sp. CBS 124048]